MSTVIEELVAVLKGDSTSYKQMMGDGVRLLTTMDTTAAKTAQRLEQVSKAWAQPQSAEEFLRNEQALRQSVIENQDAIEKEALRERMARMEQESGAKWMAEEEQRQAEEQRVKEEQADLNEFYAWRQAASQEQANLSMQLEGRLASLTTTSYEQQLEVIRANYLQRTALAQDNAKNQMLAEQVYFQEWRQLERAREAEITRDMFGRRALGRRALMQVLSAAGFATGGQVGMVSMFAMQGFATAATMVGVLAVAAIIKKIVGDQKELLEAQKKYNEELRKSRAGWLEIARAQIQTTEMGTQYGRRLLDAQDKQQEAYKAMTSYEEPGFWGVAGDMHTGKGKQLSKQYSDAYENVQMLRKLADEEQSVYLIRAEQDRIAGERAASLLTTREGPERQALQLEMDLAQKRRAIERENEDRMRASKQAWDATRRASEGPGREELDERFRLEQDARWNLFAADYEAEQRRRAFAIEQNHRVLNEQRSLFNAIVSVQQDGYAKQLAMLKLQHQKELQEYVGSGRGLINLLMRQGIEQNALAERGKKVLEDMVRGMQDRLDVALGRRAQKQIEWAAMEKQIREQSGLRGYALQHTVDAAQVYFNKLRTAEANKPLLDDMKRIQIDMDLATKKITAVQAVAKRLRLDNPDASAENIVKLAARQTALQEQATREMGQFQTFRTAFVDVQALAGGREQQRGTSKEQLRGRVRDLERDAWGALLKDERMGPVVNPKAQKEETVLAGLLKNIDNKLGQLLLEARQGLN